VPFARPLMFFIIFGGRFAIRNGDMDGKPLQSRTLRDRSETALQCGTVKRSTMREGEALTNPD
jgi:hypothetical protein